MYYDPNDPEILLAFQELELAKQELRRREEQKLFRSLREAERAGLDHPGDHLRWPVGHHPG